MRCVLCLRWYAGASVLRCSHLNRALCNQWVSFKIVRLNYEKRGSSLEPPVCSYKPFLAAAKLARLNTPKKSFGDKSKLTLDKDAPVDLTSS